MFCLSFKNGLLGSLSKYETVSRFLINHIRLNDPRYSNGAPKGKFMT